MHPLKNISPKEVRTNLAWLRNFVQQKYGPEVLFFGQKRYDLDMKAWAAEGVNNDKGVHSVGYLMQFYKW